MDWSFPCPPAPTQLDARTRLPVQRAAPPRTVFLRTDVPSLKHTATTSYIHHYWQIALLLLRTAPRSAAPRCRAHASACGNICHRAYAVATRPRLLRTYCPPARLPQPVDLA